MKFLNRFLEAKKGQARILETIIAATIIFIVFTASSFFVTSSQSTATQNRTDLDRLGYNALQKLTQSGTIEATVQQSPPQTIQLKASLQQLLPATTLFKFTVMTWNSNSNQWQTAFSPLSNSDDNAFSASAEVSSTPMIYTSTGGAHNVYYLVLVLANSGQGTD